MTPYPDQVAIGEFAEVRGGKRLPKGERVQDEATSHPYIRVVDFGYDGFNRANVKYIDEEAYRRIKRYTITSEDVYISIAGTIGRVGTIPPDFSGANLTENAAKITKIHPSIDKTFLMYFLRSPAGQAQISSRIVGTSQPKLALFRIKEIKVPRLPLPHQRKIAAILSAYDDLIENNLRRIQILEEMAQTLYREWFVEFRFPGREKVKMVDSPLGMIPEGWPMCTVSEAVHINPKTRVAREVEKPYVPMSSLSTNSMIIGDFERRTGSGGCKFRNSDTLMARITPCIEHGKTGFVQFLPSDKDIAIGSTEFIVLRPNTLNPYYVYFLARAETLRQHAINSMTGASGRQRVQMQCFNECHLAHPDKDILDRFASIVSPMFRQIHVLWMKNRNLCRTRDLLLPRLISGELDVSDLDITTTKD